jgi:ketosteroid isomerase-like protein
MQDNVALIKKIFTALEKGDIPAVLNHIDDKVTWQSPVSRTALPEIPWSGYRKSKKEVTEFFDQLGKYVQPKNFEMNEVTTQENRVVVEGKNQGKIKANNKTYEHNWVMIFTFNNDRVTKFRHYYDSADLVSMLRDVTTVKGKKTTRKVRSK